MTGNRYDHRLLQKVRESRYSQQEFANLLGVHFVTLSRLETGRAASYDLLLRVCDALDLDSSKVLYSNRQLAKAA